MERRMFFATLFFAFTAQTAEPDLSPLDERLQETRLRLALTEEQMTEVRPILQDHFDAQMAIMDKYDMDGSSSRSDSQQLRTLRQALEANKAQTAERLGAILSAEQMAEFDKIQAEHKRQALERFREKRIEDIGARLALTEEQMTEVRPILQDHFDAQMTILDKYDIGNGKRPKLRKLRALRQDLKANKAQTTKRLAAILSAEQTAEFDKIQAEQKERTREKFRSDP